MIGRALLGSLAKLALLALLATSLAACATTKARAPTAAAKVKPRVVAKHEVKAGETAFSIARRYGITVEALERANRLEDPTRIYVGRVLSIPAPEAKDDERSDDRAEERDDRPEPREARTQPRGRVTATPASAKADDREEGPRRPRDTGTSTRGKSEDESERLTAIEAEVRPTRPAPPAGCDGLSRAPKTREGKFIWPVDGVVISSFGQRDGMPHDGIDIAAPIGTPIWASKPGRVLYSGEQPGYGLLVILRHDGDVVSIYAHNAKNCVAEGDTVSQGDVIARVGDSGNATSPSVHFELRMGTKTVNPRAHLSEAKDE